MQDGYTDDEIRLLGAALAEGSPPECPRCGATLDRRPVPPRRDVSYVRDRLWLVCPRCHRTVVLDRREDL
jgi:ribosomal protein S27AE